MVLLVAGCSSSRIKVQDDSFEYTDFNMNLNEPVFVILGDDFVFRGMSPYDYKRGVAFGKEFKREISQSANLARGLNKENYTMKMDIEVFKGRYRSSAMAIISAFTIFMMPFPMEYDRSVKATYYYGYEKIGEYTFEFKRHTYKGMFRNDEFWGEIAKDSDLLAKKALSEFQIAIVKHNRNFK